MRTARGSRNVRQLAKAMVATVSILGAALAQAATVSTRYGDVEVPEKAQRVIVLSDAALDTALSVNVKPVGTVMSRGQTGGAPDYMADRAGDIELVGTMREVNIEAVLKLQPDLILASPQLTKALYSTLSQIAPTVSPAGSFNDDWRKMVGTYAKALGRKDVLDAEFANLDQRIETIKSELPDSLERVSILRWNPSGPMLMSADLFPGRVLQKLGLKLPELTYNLKRPHTDTLSLENLPQADSDFIFLATLNKDGEAALQTARQQPAFLTLDAVKEGDVASVNGDVWSSSAGLIAANEMLDDIEQNLVQQD